MDRIASERVLVGGDVNGQVGSDVGGFEKIYGLLRLD